MNSSDHDTNLIMYPLSLTVKTTNQCGAQMNFFSRPTSEFTSNSQTVICSLYSPSKIDIFLHVDPVVLELLLRVEVFTSVPASRIISSYYTIPPGAWDFLFLFFNIEPKRELDKIKSKQSATGIIIRTPSLVNFYTLFFRLHLVHICLIKI